MVKTKTTLLWIYNYSQFVGFKLEEMSLSNQIESKYFGTIKDKPENVYYLMTERFLKLFSRGACGRQLRRGVAFTDVTRAAGLWPD